MIDEDMDPVVVDLGSYMVRTGISFSGDDAPRSIYPTVYGFPRHHFMGVGMDAKEHFVGDEAVAKRGILKIRRPITYDRTPTNFQYLERILHHNFYNELRVTPEEHPTLFTSLHDMNDHACEKITKMMFESFFVPGLYIIDGSVCSIYASGRMTGLSFECGSGITLCQAVYDGKPIQNSKFVLEDQKLPPGRKRVSGELINDCIRQISLKTFSYQYNKTPGNEAIIRSIKEKFCYVHATSSWENNFIKPFNQITEKDNNDCKERNIYELLDGQNIRLGVELFLAPEILFQPSLIEEYKNVPGIHDLINLSIQNSGNTPEIYSKLYSNIIVSGGSTKLKGFSDRLENEIKKVCPTPKFVSKTKVISPPERKYSAFLGGSILSSLSTFQNRWMTKDEYDENGWSILKKKCLEITKINDQIGAFQSILFKDVDFEERLEFVKNNFLKISDVEEEGKKSNSFFKVIVGGVDVYFGCRFFL